MSVTIYRHKLCIYNKKTGVIYRRPVYFMLQVIKLTLKGNILFSFHCSPVSTFDHKGSDTIDRVTLNLHIPPWYNWISVESCDTRHNLDPDLNLHMAIMFPVILDISILVYFNIGFHLYQTKSSLTCISCIMILCKTFSYRQRSNSLNSNLTCIVFKFKKIWCSNISFHYLETL